MHADTFYDTLKDHNSTLLAHGLVQIQPGTYRHPSGLRMHVLLDYWGWTAAHGWGFLIRLIDERYEDENGIFDVNGMLDIKPANYEAYSEVGPGIYNDGGYFWFKDEQQARELITMLVPKIVATFDTWAEQQQAIAYTETRATIPKHAPLNASELRAIAKAISAAQA